MRQPAHKLRLEQTTVKVGQVDLPALNGQTSLALDGVVKGVQRDGKVSIKGWVELASKDSEIQTRLAGVNLVAFQPYLIKAAETGVKKGSMDLDLKSTVKKNRLHAPGKVTLTGLELSTGKTFMGMPREAVVGMMKDKNGRITAEFVLEGNIDDPEVFHQRQVPDAGGWRYRQVPRHQPGRAGHRHRNCGRGGSAGHWQRRRQAVRQRRPEVDHTRKNGAGETAPFRD